MGTLGIIRDILGIYVGYEVIKGYLAGEFGTNPLTIIAAAILLLMGIWFLLERIGILSR